MTWRRTRQIRPLSVRRGGSTGAIPRCAELTSQAADLCRDGQVHLASGGFVRETGNVVVAAHLLCVGRGGFQIVACGFPT
jgi:hypothetical protein